ncbi:MAG: hypothetical protein ACSHX9_07845 [Luteolibacter sp.]
MKSYSTHLIPLIVAFTYAPLAAEIDKSFSKSDQEIDAFYGTHSDRNAAAQYAALAGIEERMEKIDNFTRASNIEFFGDSLRKLARKNIFQVSRRIEVYDKVQQSLLSIPGHAEFYAEPIWESYRAYRDPSHPKHSGSANAFDWEAQIGLETLKHLPSSETVKVLGGMLWEDWEAERNTGPGLSDLTYPSALAYQATWTLGDLPLRDKPSPQFKRRQAKDHLPAWQDWYEKVKAGEIAFSFVGQPVEYRFQADVSVSSTLIEIPKDEQENAAAAEREQRHPTNEDDGGSKFADAPAPSSEMHYWRWVIAGFAAMIVFSGFLILKKKS